MNINIKATNIELTPAISLYATKKVESLEKFAGSVKIDAEVQAWVEVGRTTRHHEQGDIFRAEIQMKLPNYSLRAEAEGEDLYAAIDKVHDEMQREINKAHGRQIARLREGARRIKGIFKGFYKK
ncbi:MAG: ribosome-associated translation inhibitor RaiA [Parcubacteria group bacterium]|nr:ribosome-associated translation inhibitor RaiA [Parcubacteria group bacterium]MCR4342851.1 ribosome-associated translation inhibitor RaiA [Patescibacteria group bacterium]